MTFSTSAPICKLHSLKMFTRFTFVVLLVTLAKVSAAGGAYGEGNNYNPVPLSPSRSRLPISRLLSSQLSIGQPSASGGTDLYDQLHGVIQQISANGKLMKNPGHVQKHQHVETIHQCCINLNDNCRDIDEGETCEYYEYENTERRLVTTVATLNFVDPSEDDSENEHDSPTQAPTNGNAPSRSGASPSYTAAHDEDDLRQPQNPVGNRNKPNSATNVPGNGNAPSRFGSLKAQDYNDDDSARVRQPSTVNSRNAPVPAKQNPLQNQLLDTNGAGNDVTARLDKLLRRLQSLKDPAVSEKYKNMISKDIGNNQVAYMHKPQPVMNHEYVKPLNLDNDTVKKIRNQNLEKTNIYRSYYGFPQLKLNENLNNYAQEWANKLAEQQKSEHRPENTRIYGENIFESGRLERIGAVAADCWFNELEFVMEEDSELTYIRKAETEIGHLTQMMWHASTELGVGVARNADNKKFYIVANYNPRGNYGYFYKDNLPSFKKQEINDARAADAESKRKNSIVYDVFYPEGHREPTSEEMQRDVENLTIGIPKAMNYSPVKRQRPSWFTMKPR